MVDPKHFAFRQAHLAKTIEAHLGIRAHERNPFVDGDLRAMLVFEAVPVLLSRDVQVVAHVRPLGTNHEHDRESTSGCAATSA